MRTALLRATLPFLVLLASAGCRPRGPAAPVHASDDAAFAAAETAPLPGLDPDDRPIAADRIRPGDVLALRVLGATGLDQPAMPVDRSGRVHLALSGDVSIAEQTLPDAEERLTVAMRKHDRFAQAVLTVVDAKGRFASVIGAVDKPGNVPLVGEGRVAEVLAAAGGPKFTTVEDRLVALGDLDAARVTRDGQALPIDLRLAMQGDRRHDVRLLPGDVIFVPPLLDGRISVLGHVSKPRTMAFRRGLRLTEALAEAGGTTQPADLQDVRVLRGGLVHPRMYVANLRDVLAARRPDVELAPGDVVFVTEHWFATTTDVLGRLVPAVATTILASTLAK
jgi:polysaccharide biosynthesis/export protein